MFGHLHCITLMQVPLGAEPWSSLGLCCLLLATALSYNFVAAVQAKAGEVELEAVRQLPDSDERDRDCLVPLIAEALNEGGTNSVLVFCSSRKQCQSCADMVADLLPGHLTPVSQVWDHPLLTFQHA